MSSRLNLTAAAAATTTEQQPLQQQQQKSWWHPCSSFSHHAAASASASALAPIDPPEDIVVSNGHFYNVNNDTLVGHLPRHQQNIMNDDVDAIVNSLSLRPPDPPGWNSKSIGKRKYNSRFYSDDDDKDEHH